MKWFKHKTNCSDREFMTILEEKFGLEGYARWFKILEEIGKNMSGANGCSATYPWSKWQTILKGKRKKLETFLEHLMDESKINLKETGNILEIECPKILEIKDEYSRKSGHAPDEPPGNSRLRGKTKENTDKRIKTSGRGNAERAGGDERGEPPPPQPGEGEFFQEINQAHREALGFNLTPPNAKDRARIRALLLDHDRDLLVAAFREFVVSSDPWLVKFGKPRNVAVFAGQVALGNFLTQGAARLERERGALKTAGELEQEPRPPSEPSAEERERWGRCFRSLFGMVPRETAEVWFAPLEFAGIEGGRFYLRCPNPYYRNCIRENYLDLVTTQAREVFPETRQVVLTVAEEVEP